MIGGQCRTTRHGGTFGTSYGDAYQPPLRARLRHLMAQEVGSLRRQAVGDTAA
ncbi:hypothetical protein [Nonomuraea sp. NPDC049750]|uniref:hypothetical protein n=1 Tax=Nonomuraea sp. NPDC049750 TaxID=3154738 RepID=UPI0033F3F09F